MDGGELGWSNPGDYDPAFEQTLNAQNWRVIQTGEIFGWHVIEVMDRRNEMLAKKSKKIGLLELFLIENWSRITKYAIRTKS